MNFDRQGLMAGRGVEGSKTEQIMQQTVTPSFSQSSTSVNSPMNANSLSKPRALLATCCVALVNALPGAAPAQVAIFDPQEGLKTVALETTA